MNNKNLFVAIIIISGLAILLNIFALSQINKMKVDVAMVGEYIGASISLGVFPSIEQLVQASQQAQQPQQARSTTRTDMAEDTMGDVVK